MNKTMRSLLVGITLLLSCCDGLVVPGEVFSLLSSAIQTIPKIAKGTDSRFGVGFRFGEHADFQSIIELGPQKFTKPLGKIAVDDSEESDPSKRMVNLSKYNNIMKPTYEKKNQWTKEMKIKHSNHAKKPQITGIDSIKLLFGPKDQYPIPTTSIINPFALRQVQQLHSKSNKTIDQAIWTHSATKLKNEQQIKSDLMDVSLDH